jgi:epoxyqueuosine reductase
MSLERQIKDRALQVGFDAVGITDASALDPGNIERLQTWLASGCAGQMHYMHRHFDKRICPAALLEGAASVIVVALAYKPPVSSVAQPPPAGIIADMACYDDYHVVIKSLLYELASDIRTWAPEPTRFRVCVDSVPLAERALAVRAGLGFIGLNHMLIHPTLGPQVFLGELITTLPLIPDEPGRMGFSPCGQNCRRCVQACPTGALQDDGRLDARRCISYLTIEHKGDIDSELSRQMGHHLFGCDECTRVCPFHEAAPPCTNPALRYHPDRDRLDLHDLLTLDRESFASRFADSPLTRAGLDTLMRNARICLQNGWPNGRDWPL